MSFGHPLHLQILRIGDDFPIFLLFQGILNKAYAICVIYTERDIFS